MKTSMALVNVLLTGLAFLPGIGQANLWRVLSQAGLLLK
jgi:hypothetical protein